MNMIDDAEEAILDAVVARIDADAVQTTKLRLAAEPNAAWTLPGGMPFLIPRQEINHVDYHK